MERNVDLKEISDGKLYGLNDMVKACSNNCEGCSSCCHGMGDTITLDPLDICRLKMGLSRSFEELLAHGVHLGVVNGIIRPSLMMTTDEDERCVFLNEQGWCDIHGFRPGLCRLFPLGRVYEEDGMKYILLANECYRENRTKVKVRKWIDTPNIGEYEKFLTEWHNFLKEMQAAVESSQDQEYIKRMNMTMLQLFFVQDFAVMGEEVSEELFYLQFRDRLKQMRNVLDK